MFEQWQVAISIRIRQKIGKIGKAFASGWPVVLHEKAILNQKLLK